MKRPGNLALASILTMDHDETKMTPSCAKKRRLLNGSKWDVKDLPEMPYLYLKEKTSTVILNDSPQEIASRIVNAAKDMNCIGEYDDIMVRLDVALQ
jgi:hypothetical protein